MKLSNNCAQMTLKKKTISKIKQTNPSKIKL